MLQDTLKFARIYNGNVGTITAIDAETGVIRARLDAASGQEGREVEWCSAKRLSGFRLSCGAFSKDAALGDE